MARPVLINARFLTQATTGVQRYAIEVVKAWDAMLASGELDKKTVNFELVAPRGALPDLKLRNIPVRQLGRFRGIAWEQLDLPAYAAGSMLINLCNSAPLLKRKQTVTIHDASVFGFPQAYSFRFRTWYKFLHTVLGMTAQRILTDSRFAQAELIKYCRIPEHRIRMVHLGSDHMNAIPVDEGIISRNGLNKVKFVLAVSSMSPHKNFQAIVNAIPLMKNDSQIVIAGGLNPRVFNQSAAPLPASVMQLGYVSDAELRALYEHATCFVYPSFYEGFGLPPLEAMACACPVIVSNAASLPEVCGDAALYCNPHDAADIAEKIDRLMSDQALRDALRIKALARARQFTWAACARDTWLAIEAASTH